MLPSSNCSPISNVYLRIKPSSAETNSEMYTVLNSTTFLVKKNGNVDKKYTFTRISDSDCSQADFFRHSIRQQIINFLLGENSTILTYGASNSGKTYTLYGTPESPGIIPRSMEFLFSAINCTLAPWYKVTDDNRIVALDEYERTFEIRSKEDIINPRIVAKDEYAQAQLSLDNSYPELTDVEERELCGNECMSSVWISVVEIYNDNVYDLLNIGDREKRPLKMSTRKDGSTYVNGLKFLHITTALEACQLLVFVQSRMTVASTAVNVASSRSHTLLTMKLLNYKKENVPDEVQVGTLTFCDVAGSRRFKKREETGVRLTESRNINNSLLVLGRCLKNVRESHSIGDVHVAGPFRESKLTRILQKALAGREKINFIVNVNTEADNFAETLSILNFSAIARKLGTESRVRRMNTFSMMTPRSAKSSTTTSVVQTPEKLVTIDFEKRELLKQQNKKLIEKLEAMKIVNYKEQSTWSKVSVGTQSENSYFDYKELEEKNATLTKNLEALECYNLNRELEIRQEMADQYSAAIGDIEVSWKKRTQDVEDEGRDLLKWSVNQVEAFYKERIDSIIYNKKRKRSNNDSDVGIRSICQELETENAMITSKVVVLREMIRSLRIENELLSTDRNKCNFELVLMKEKLKGLYDLVRIHFPELFLKAEDDANDSCWFVHELKRMFDEKSRSIEILEKDLSEERSKSTEMEVREKINFINNLQLQLQSLGKELANDFFCSDNIDNAKLITQAHVDIKADSYFNYDNKNSSKKVSLNSMDVDIDRHTFRSSDSNDAKEDSGIDFSCRSQRSTCVNEGSIIQETKENCTQTISSLEDNSNACKGMKQLMTDGVNLVRYTEHEEETLFDKELPDQVNDMKSVISNLKQIADFNKCEVAECKSKLLSCEAKMEELEKENEKLTKMIEIDSQKYNQRIEELTQELLIKEENENRDFDKLVTELLGKISAEEIGGKTTEARSDLFGVQQLHEKVNGVETVLEKCREEKNNYRKRLQEHLETQSILEMKLKWLSSEIQSRDDESISSKMEINNRAAANNLNDENVKNLGEQANEKKKHEGEEFCRLKLQLFDNEQELDLVKKHRNDMIKKYECMVQHLRIEVEKRKERLIKLQKQLLSNFTWKYRKLSGKRREKSLVFKFQKSTKRANHSWELPGVNKKASNEESFTQIFECSLVDPRYAHSLNSKSSIKNTEIDANSVCKTEESCPTENSPGLNDSNVDARQIQSDASDCSEVRCGCGIGFKNARRQGRMSGWMKVRRSNARTDLLHKLNGENTRVWNGAFKTDVARYHSQ